MLPLTTLRAQDWFLEGGVLQPLLSLASDADDTCRCASAVVAHTMRRLLSAGSRAFQEVYGVSRRPRSMACICPGACVAAVLHLPPLKAPCTVDIGELYVGMMRCHPSLLGVSGSARMPLSHQQRARRLSCAVFGFN